MAGGGETTSTVHQSSLPEYAQPYYENLMDRSLSESLRPYQPYGGQRLAGPNTHTMSGLNMANQYANSGMGAVPLAQDITTQTGLAGLAYSDYQASPVNNRYTAPRSYSGTTFRNSYNGPVGGNYQAGNFSAERVGFGGPSGVNRVNTQDFGQAQADRYMSPYMQSVIDRARQDNSRATLEEQTYRDGQAARAGAFGGSRAAVQNQMALNASQDRNVDISVQGHQAAFENAQAQFERDRQARQLSEQANQGTSLQMALANQGQALEAQGMREQSRQFGFGANQSAAQRAAELGLQAQNLGEQSRQFGFSESERNRQIAAQYGMDADRSTEQLRQSGMQLGLEGLQTSQRAAAQMNDIQSNWDRMVLDRVRAQLGVGQTLEDYQQESLDQAYSDFINQRDAGRQNLQFYSSLLQGVPISPNSDVTQRTPTNPVAGALGTYGGLQALYALGNQ